MSQHLPILVVLVPLLAAPIVVLLRERRLAVGFTAATCWAVFAGAVALLRQVATDGTVVYHIANWNPPWGIEYRVDLLSAFVVLFVSLIGALTASFAPASLRAEIDNDKHYLFSACYLLCMTGLLGIAVTGDLFNVFVFLEISSLSSYAMIAMGRTRRALTASFNYLIMGTIGATFILIAIGLIFMMTGSLNMADVASKLGGVESSRAITVAFAFFTVGVGLKMAMFPLHAWLPGAYTHAPSVASAFLAATATKVSVYVLLRFTGTVFGLDFSFETLPLDSALMAAGLLGMFFGSLLAIFQSDVKRLLAYSSIAQIGYMLLGIGLATASGLTAGIVHLFNHALTKGGLFLATACFVLRLRSSDLSQLGGIGRRMPVTTFLWVLGGLSLIGMPATAGFVSKWYLVRATLERDLWWMAALILLSSLLAVAYVWRVVEVLYFKPSLERDDAPREAPWSMLVPTAALILCTIYFGLRTEWSASLAERAASALLGGA